MRDEAGTQGTPGRRDARNGNDDIGGDGAGAMPTRSKTTRQDRQTSLVGRADWGPRCP